MTRSVVVATVAALVVLSGVSVVAVAQENPNDQFEPNDERAEATNLEPGSLDATVAEPSDADYYAINLSAGEILDLRLEPENESADVDLTVYGPDGEQVAFSGYTSNQRTFERLAIKADANGTYAVAVTGDMQTNYTLKSEVRDEAPDRFTRDEPNDNVSAAVPVDDGRAEGFTYPSDDVDVFRVNASAGDRLTVSPDFPTEEGHLVVSVLNAEREELLSTTFRTRNASSSARLPEDGPAYLVVQGYAGAALDYSLDVDVHSPKKPSAGGTPAPQPPVDGKPAGPTGSLTFENQTTSGENVTVQSATLSEGGFVAIYSRTDDGGFDRILGVSEFLDAGDHENVTVELEERLAESGTLTAVAYRDTDGDEQFDFRRTAGAVDGPYVDNGELVADDATVTLERKPTTSVTFENQTTSGENVTIQSANLSEGGFLAVYGQENGELDRILGVSEFLDAGDHENVTVELEERLAESGNLTVVAFRDTDGDEQFDFRRTAGAVDGAYTIDGELVSDEANVTVQRPEAEASVTFENQTTSGENVTIQSANLSEGGFLAVHSADWRDDPTETVLGTSEYLDPGEHENVTVELDEPLTENATLVAMPHQDTNGNEQFDFVTSDGEADGAYTANGTPVTDEANVTVEPVEPAASVTFDEQTTSGENVTVQSVNLSEGGFVAVHSADWQDDPTGTVLGTSEYLQPGEHENVTVELDEPLTENATLVAMPHQDTNGNEAFDFVTSDGEADGAYTANGTPVTDEANVTVEQVPPATASVAFENQTTDGESVTVQSANLSEGGFVVIYDSTYGAPRGATTYLEPGQYEDLTVELDPSLTENRTLTAVAYRDVNGDEQFDFMSDIEGDTSYDGESASDEAFVTVEGNVTVEQVPATPDNGTAIPDNETVTDNETETPDNGTVAPDNETATPDDTPVTTTTPSGDEPSLPDEVNETGANATGDDAAASEPPLLGGLFG